MREINLIVGHCSATPPQFDIGAAELRDLHAGTKDVLVGGVWNDIGKITGYTYHGRGWSDIGYHLVIRRNGRREAGRPMRIMGAHARGYNEHSIGICLIGGVNEHTGEPESNFTLAQFRQFVDTVSELKDQHPNAEVLGHRDLSPDANHDSVITPDEWLKECPCFDVRSLLESAIIGV